MLDRILQHVSRAARGLHIYPTEDRPNIEVQRDRPYSERHIAGKSFDYIVVGSGPAGCAVVAKLAEAKNDRGESPSILLLEAGRDQRSMEDAQLPNRWLNVLMGDGIYLNHALDWGYETYHRVHGRWDGTARGKTLGGSAAVNAQMWVLGDPKDWDSLNVPGWAWSSIAPHFSWLNEKFAPRLVSKGNATLKLIMESLKSFQIVENHQNAILNGNVESPISHSLQNNDPGQRRNPFSVLVEPLLSKSNICVVDAATVQKIVLNDNKEAVGVVFSSSGVEGQMVKANREVILAAGSYGTPQILMLSGIGPANELKRHSIPLVADLPVGETLFDHPNCQVGAFLKERCQAGDGSCVDATGFIKTAWSKQNEPERGRDLQIICTPLAPPDMLMKLIVRSLVAKAVPVAPKASTKGRLHIMSANVLYNAFKRSHVLDDKVARCILLTVSLNHPRSRGSVTLRSSDYRDAPVIDLGLLTAKEDMPRLVEGLKMCVQALKSEPLASQIESFDPNAQALLNGSDDAYVKHILATGSHIWHPVGTAPIGPVLDSHLRVRGIRNLRCADCSVLPNATSGNTMVPALLVGARAGEILAHSWKLSDSRAQNELSA